MATEYLSPLMFINTPVSVGAHRRQLARSNGDNIKELNLERDQIQKYGQAVMGKM